MLLQKFFSDANILYTKCFNVENIFNDLTIIKTILISGNC